MRTLIQATFGVLVAGALMACSSSSSTGPTGGNSTTIVASSSTTGGGAYGAGGNYFFSPNPDTVSAGAVTFQIGSVEHNVHFDTGPVAIDSIPAASNTSVSRTFSTSGTYTFHCTIHNFSGTLVVN